MAITAVNDALTALYLRVRDPAGTVHSDVALDVLSDCQRLVNACYGAALTDATITLTPGQTFIPWTSIASDVVRIVHVIQDERTVAQVPWQSLATTDVGWVHARGQNVLAWDSVGHSLLVVYPTPDLASARSITVRYVAELVDLVSGGTFVVPPTYVTLCIDLAAEILLLRQRLFPSIDEAAQAVFRHARPRITDDL